MARLYTPIDAPTLGQDGVAHEPTPEEREAQKKEIAAVALANQEKYEDAVAALTAIIESVPSYASAYNNRYGTQPCPFYLLMVVLEAVYASSRMLCGLMVESGGFG